MKSSNGFGEWLRVLREDEKKMTQPEFAALLGVGESVISAVELGRRKPTAGFILKLGKGLEWTRDEIFTKLAELGFWDGPITVDNSDDAWWIAKCKRAARGASRPVLDDAVAAFEFQILLNKPK